MLEFDAVSPPCYGPLRITVPALEALKEGLCSVSKSDQPRSPQGFYFYTVTLEKPPTGLRLVLVGLGDEQHYGLHLESEPPYPGEWSNGVAWHEQAQWLPCPRCGRALVWFEAGYVPGYRICLSKHHVQVDETGHGAKFIKKG